MQHRLTARLASSLARVTLGQRAQAAVDAHLAAALGFLEGDYMGEHWLSSFALLALDADGADSLDFQQTAD